MARPIPREAPVTRATRPARRVAPRRPRPGENRSVLVMAARVVLEREVGIEALRCEGPGRCGRRSGFHPGRPAGRRVDPAGHLIPCLPSAAQPQTAGNLHTRKTASVASPPAMPAPGSMKMARWGSGPRPGPAPGTPEHSNCRTIFWAGAEAELTRRVDLWHVEGDGGGSFPAAGGYGPAGRPGAGPSPGRSRGGGET